METVNLKDSPEEKSSPPKRRTPTDKKLAESITATYQGIGGTVATIGFQLDDQGITGVGVGLIEQAETISEAWLDLANQSPKVKKALQRFVEASAAGTLVALHLSVITPLLLDRGIIPNFATKASQNGDLDNE